MTKRKRNGSETTKAKKLPPSQNRALARDKRSKPPSSSGDDDNSGLFQVSPRGKKVTVDSLKVRFDSVAILLIYVTYQK